MLQRDECLDIQVASALKHSLYMCMTFVCIFWLSVAQILAPVHPVCAGFFLTYKYLYYYKEEHMAGCAILNTYAPSAL